MFKIVAPEGWKVGSWRSSIKPELPVNKSTYIEDSRRLY